MRRLFLVLPLVLPLVRPDGFDPRPEVSPSANGVLQDERPPAKPKCLRKLKVWTMRARRGRDGLDDKERALLREVLDETDRLRRADPSRSAEIDLALFDLAALALLPEDQKDPEGYELTLRVAGYGRQRLVDRLRDDERLFGDWLARAVLDDEDLDDEVRVLACQLLAGLRIPETRASLLRLGRTDDGVLGEAAVAALVGWPDPLVHDYFLDRLEPGGAGISALAEHLALVADELSPGMRERVRELVGELYLSEEWRDAARARRLVRVLKARRAIPLLLEALALWNRRGERGEGSSRITAEIVKELQRLSGRSIGPRPDRWTTWWNAVLEGRVELKETVERKGGFVSTASFFGLNVHSDRIAFVIDRSGSMDNLLGTGGRSRFDEAVEQFVQFLEKAGEPTHFSLVLFGDKGTRWPGGLAPANAGHLEQARRWLERNQPEGGTRLFEGLREALALDRSGRLDPERLEVDTVIVLCDGATAEGPDWVRPWMRRENEEAQVVFHCVQIGRTGNGTLEALAEATGGDFVRVE